MIGSIYGRERERMAKRVGVVILGDEVLKAEIREANLAYILPLLNEWGAEVALCAILPDDVPVVVRHLRAALDEVDLLVLTGGIGPTPDDITREAVARVAGVPLVVHPEADALLKSYYKGRWNDSRMDGPGMTEARMVMAQVPEGATLIPNPVSAAPGFYIGRMAAFPGIPRLLHEMFGWIRPLVEGRRKSRVTLFSEAPESAFAAIMRESMDAFPAVSVGSYPIIDGKYRVRVVFRSDDFTLAASCADFFTGKIGEGGWDVLRREEERA
ncbi:MAG: molybdopterin-binding protein [Deltaproteobacteria bacterium]|nr:molybdopterin-binding protein [Deltaproteobacteria bacterium]